MDSSDHPGRPSRRSTRSRKAGEPAHGGVVRGAETVLETAATVVAVVAAAAVAVLAAAPAWVAVAAGDTMDTGPLPDACAANTGPPT